MLAELYPAPDQVIIAIGTVMMDLIQMFSQDTTGRHALTQSASDSRPMAYCLVPPREVPSPSAA